MAKKANDSIKTSSDNRDETQRSLGCVGISAMAHVGLLIAVVLAPSFKTQMGEAAGTQAGIEFAGVEMANASSAAAPSAAAQNQTAPMEVLLADASDKEAVTLPAAAIPVAATPVAAAPQALAPKPIAKPALTKKIAVKSNDISSALKTARSQPAAAKPTAEPIKAVDVSPVGETEIATETPPEALPVEKAQIIAANDEDQPAKLTSPEPAADADDDDQDSDSQQGSAVVSAPHKQTESPAVPLRIALPENEALTTAQENALQAPPIQKAASTSGASSSPMIGAGTGPASPASRGGGTSGYSVPLGAPVRDARTLMALQNNPKPVYPLPDKLAGRQGTAVLVAKVKQDGTVENVTLEKSSGSKMMDESAATAFKSWKYKPGQEGYVRLPVQFQLVGDAKIIPAQLKRQ